MVTTNAPSAKATRKVAAAASADHRSGEFRDTLFGRKRRNGVWKAVVSVAAFVVAPVTFIIKSRLRLRAWLRPADALAPPPTSRRRP